MQTGALLIAVSLIVLLSFASTMRHSRKWAPHEVPLAFWAWRDEAPANSDVQKAINDAGTQAIFLRAGQIDYQNGNIRRIRTVAGPLPRGVAVHLVYNGTRSLLSQFGTLDEAALATTINAAYSEDLERAARDRTQVEGIQIDIDVPTRLLDRYAKLLQSIRKALPQNTKLSVTGLATWMNSPDLLSVFKETDFWIPQCYGAEIPRRLSDLIPISSAKSVAAAVVLARKLGEPFYAGLAAYGYVLLYSSDGRLLTIRGDMDPSRIAQDSNLDFVERQPFEPPDKSTNKVTSEWRYLYRARADGVIDHLSMRAGDYLVIDLPTTESLRAAARAVRESAGEQLLGICIFRLPATNDPSTLSLAKVKTALNDLEAMSDLSVAATLPSREERTKGTHPVLVTLSNGGTTDPLLNESVNLEISVPTGTRVMKANGFQSAETLCRINHRSLEPCSERLANTIRLRAVTLSVARNAEATLVFNSEPARELKVHVEAYLEDGEVLKRHRQLVVTQENEK